MYYEYYKTHDVIACNSDVQLCLIFHLHPEITTSVKCCSNIYLSVALCVPWSGFRHFRS